jgi:chromosome segregation ATPase
MGLSAHDDSLPGANTPPVSDHQALLDEIDALLASASRDAAVIERTLTDGYAQALSLEAERWRIQKRLGAVAATLQAGDVSKKTKELSELAQRLESQNAALIELRHLLTQLRSEYTEATTPVAAPRRRVSRR